MTGRVVFADRVAGRGVVVLRTRAARFTFEPVTAAPRVGRRVRQGEPIGRLAHGGHCDGRCLHWGAKVDGQYVDPMAFLPRSRPVLKPVIHGRT
jgi:murein DD-endopeptidase MepM/ murein hydrolase activator NlpD